MADHTPSLTSDGISVCNESCPCAHRPWPKSAPHLMFCHGCDKLRPQVSPGDICIAAAVDAMRATAWFGAHGLAVSRATDGTWGASVRGAGGPYEGATPVEAMEAARKAGRKGG